MLANFRGFLMVDAKVPSYENKDVTSVLHRLQKNNKKRMLNAGVTLNVDENEEDKKLTWIKFAPNLEC
jgi:hypothetical protein